MENSVFPAGAEVDAVVGLAAGGCFAAGVATVGIGAGFVAVSCLGGGAAVVVAGGVVGAAAAVPARH